MQIFDLKNNNAALNVIAHRSTRSLQDIFQSIVLGTPINENYFELNGMFRNFMSSHGTDGAIDVLSQVVTRKLEVLQHALVSSKRINLSKYVDIWSQYSDFTERLTYLIANRIPVEDLAGLYSSLFFDHILLFNISGYNKIFVLAVFDSIIEIMGKDDVSSDEYFVGNLVQFAVTLNLMITCRESKKSHFDAEKLLTDLLSNQTVAKSFCSAIHSAMMEIKNDDAILSNPNFYMIQPYVVKRTRISSATNIVALLHEYVRAEKQYDMMMTYIDYLQLRIVTPKYGNLDQEIVFAEMLSCKKIINAIQDVKNNMRCDVNGVKIMPLILTKNNWNINPATFKINYPAQIKNCIDAIARDYQCIEWQPTLGMCRLQVRNIAVTCNFLQAIALTYFDEKTEKIFTVREFSEYTLINLELSCQIFESLYESFLIVCDGFANEDPNLTKYVMNTKYNGKTKLDIRPLFLLKKN